MAYKWILKAIVQKTLSFLPNPEKANHWFQKNVTKGVHLTDEHLGHKVRHASDHLTYFQKYGQPTPDRQILELGTGWYPIVPLLFYVSEGGQVTSIDIQSWMSRDSAISAIDRLFEWKRNGQLAEVFSHPQSESRWETLDTIRRAPEKQTLSSIAGQIGLTLVQGDVRTVDLSGKQFDLICSNNTFEHIYPEVLTGILERFKTLVKSGGVMSHFIDMTDHFAHFDQQITVYHFLRFSASSWRWIDNSIQPQNRMRFPQYLDMYRSLSIPITETALWPYDPADLLDLPIHESFQQFSRDDLAIKHGYVISKC